MLIKVLYGDNKTLLCNSTCSVVNLIRYIQIKTGFTEKVQLDLADETGLVVKLSPNPTEYADKYAASGTYILVEKQLRSESGMASPKKNQDPYTYTSLLDNYRELFPNIVGFHTTLETPVRKDRNKLQSPSHTRKLKPASPQRPASKSASSSKKSAGRANAR